MVVSSLTHKQLKPLECIPSNLATDALVLKHQATSSHIAEWIFGVTSLIQNVILTVKFIRKENDILKTNRCLKAKRSVYHPTIQSREQLDVEAS